MPPRNLVIFKVEILHSDLLVQYTIRDQFNKAPDIYIYIYMISPIEENVISFKLLPCQYYCMDAPLRLLRNALNKNHNAAYTRMLHIVLNKSRQQHPTKLQIVRSLTSNLTNH